VEKWKQLRAVQDPRFLRAIGWGADMNGFGAQGPPRHGDNPVHYPFKSFDGRVTFERQRTGTRVFDINDLGVAHYGMYPDWVEDLRQIAGQKIVDDLSQGAEAYLEMWERAVGVAPRYRCKSRRLHFKRGGLGTVAFGFSYCVKGGGSVRVGFDRHGMSQRITYRVGRRVRTQTRRGARAGRSASSRLLPR
jgi:hypothetical protein